MDHPIPEPADNRTLLGVLRIGDAEMSGELFVRNDVLRSLDSRIFNAIVSSS